MGTFVKIATVNAGVNSLANVTFSSIPQTYTDLMIIFSLRLNSGTNVGGGVSINGTSGSAPLTLINSQSGLTSEINNLTGFASSSSYSAGAFSNGYIYLPAYTSSANKYYYFYSGTGVVGSSQSYMGLSIGGVNNTSPTTSFTLGGETLAPYSTAYLYGIKNS
jgi:hypothetical protein